MQRLQAGMLGLAAMLLLVGLANIIMDRAREADGVVAAAPTRTSTTDAAPKNDPLADMGVVPSASASAGTKAVPSASGAGTAPPQANGGN
ncbi:hypothetical protein ACOYW6_00600 [Parablastomonas sp. CN1-191]|uniref:hypothetical protein n=1 Tax=Parablastomonas sp. CN1-191 TaxID=3400908 RepID=UPI003BF86AC0